MSSPSHEDVDVWSAAAATKAKSNAATSIKNNNQLLKLVMLDTLNWRLCLLQHEVIISINTYFKKYLFEEKLTNKYLLQKTEIY